MDLTQILAGALVGVLLSHLVINRKRKPKTQAQLVATEVKAAKKYFGGMVGVEWLRHDGGLTHTVLIDGRPAVIVRDPDCRDARGLIKFIRHTRGL